MLLLAFGALLGVAVFVAWWRRLRPRFPDDRLGAAALAVVLLAFCSALAVVPYSAWRIAEDIDHTSSLSRSEAETTGASLNSLSPGVFDELRRAIPPGDSYFVDVAPDIGSPPSDAFPEWSASALLPRLPVRSPERADWIVTWGIPPDSYDVPLARVRVVAPASERLPEAYLARVAG